MTVFFIMTAAIFIKLRLTIIEKQQNSFVCLSNTNKKRVFKSAFLLGVSFSVFPYSVQAEENLWRLCATSTKIGSGKSILGKASDVSAGKEMKFTADEFEVHGSQYILNGKVKGGRSDQQLSADSLSYDKNSDLAHATGSVRYEHGDRILVGDNAIIDLGKNSGSINPARFWFTDKHIRGQADSIQFEGASESR